MSAEQCSDPWTGFTVSPKGLFPGFVSDPWKETLLESNCKSDDCNSALNSEKKLEEKEDGLSSVVGTGNSAFRSGGSIAERRAAKFGFDASKINTCSFKSSSTLDSQASPSQYLLRTPGISPGALLESPMMLPNLQPSPTTGAFGLPHLSWESRVIRSESYEADKESDDTSSFTFNPNGKPIPMSFYSAINHQYLPSSMPQNSGIEFGFQHPAATLPPVNGGFEFPTRLPSEATVNTSEFNSSPDSKISSDVAVKANSSDFQLGDSVIAAGFEVQQNECNKRENAGNLGGDNYPMDGDVKVMDSSEKTVFNSEDGYNWRKYGQKQVKASEFPRSYYKCTHPNCPVKKKVEHSRDGQIREVVYRGTHNHQKPQLNRRSSFGSSVSCGESLDVGDGLERTCSIDVSNPLPANEAKSAGALESAGTPELSSTLASNDEVEEEDAVTQGSMLVVDNDNDNDEPDLKRRKMESSLIETALASRAIREPRVIVQIESEVDILDDGYRWRKYGQKVVKGNPNPRSYYKCTYPGCSVRKHVERASHNLKFVLTTYEGKHNHEVPSARNSSHQSPAPSAHNPQEALNSHHLPKSEPQDFAAHSNRRVEYNKEFLKPNYFGNFTGAAPSLYQMKFPNFPNNVLYGSYGLNPNYESAATVPNSTNLSIPPPMGFNLPPNMGIPNNNQGRPLGMIQLQPMFPGQPPKEGDVKFLQPMQD